ncbi:hypothetical protein UGMREWDR_CDS0078 [Aeromonas phage GomatiRiver_11]|nr:hypothetical protein OBDJBBDK_00072 [Aeromonas phage AhFM11]WKW84245.1 hypothetical protein UGMREWDR_CDS0078 [Aeromonas phage GomatiRiver_11]
MGEKGMYQIIFIVVVTIAVIACFVSMWDDHWRDKARKEQEKINKWLSRYGISMNFKTGKAGAFEKVVFFIPGGDNVKFSDCKGIRFRKAYKMLEKIREGNIQDPDYDQTGNLMSMLYLSQVKSEKKTVWED